MYNTFFNMMNMFGMNSYGCGCNNYNPVVPMLFSGVDGVSVNSYGYGYGSGYGCGCGYNPGSIWLGNMAADFLGIGLGIAFNSIENRQAINYENEQKFQQACAILGITSSDPEDIKSGLSEANVNNYAKYKAAHEKVDLAGKGENGAIGKAMKEVSDDKTGLNATINKITATKNNIKELRENPPTKDTPSADMTEYNKKIQELENLLNNQKAEKARLQALKNSYENGELKKNFEQAKQEEAAAKKEFNEAKEIVKEYLNNYNNKTLDKGSGNIFNRKNIDINKLGNNTEFDEATARGLINKFNDTDTSPNDKQKIKKFVTDHKDEINGINKKSIRDSLRIIIETELT